MNIKAIFRRFLGIDKLDAQINQQAESTNRALQQFADNQTATTSLLNIIVSKLNQFPNAPAVSAPTPASTPNNATEDSPASDSSSQPQPQPDDKDRIIAELQEKLSSTKDKFISEYFAQYAAEAEESKKSGPGRPMILGEKISLKLDLDLTIVINALKDRFNINKSEYLSRKIREGIEKDFPELLAEIYKTNHLAARAANQRQKTPQSPTLL